MEFFMIELIFVCIIQGMYGTSIHHHESITAVEGNNISLPCIVKETNNRIIQMEWIKRQQGIEEKIAVFHPNFPIKYFKNHSVLEARKNSETSELEGSVLNLLKVTVNDNGNYICEITSFPYGSIKKTTKLYVTGPLVSLKMTYPDGFVKEGDEVHISCSTSPPSLHYELRRSKDELFLLESLSGEFILANISRMDSDLYICFPKWDTSDQHRKGLNSTMELTVNFLDSTDCNTSSLLKVTIGENVMISCKTKASQQLLYKWTKGGTTVSFSDTLSLSSVTSDQSGTYKLTAAFPNNQLWTDMEFVIHVLPDTREGSTTVTSSPSVRSFSTSYPFLNQTTKPLSDFTSVETSLLPTTMTSSQSGLILTSATQPNVTVTTVEHRNTSHHSPLNDSSSASPAANTSTLQPHIENQTSTSFTFNTSTAAVSTSRRELVTFIVTNKSTINFTLRATTVITQKATKSATYILIPILLLLLVLVVLLYRRHLKKKRMDMPPPFKPPPPPVKYTSVRKDDIRMTDV